MPDIALTILVIYFLAAAHYLWVQPAITDRLDHARNKRAQGHRRRELRIVNAQLTDERAKAAHAKAAGNHPARVAALTEAQRLEEHANRINSENAIEHVTRRARRQGRPARGPALVRAANGQRGFGFKADPVKATAYDDQYTR